MKRAICVACMVVLTGAGASSVLGASAKCTVEKVEGARLVIDCGQKAPEFQEGTKIKIKTARKTAVEGC